MIQTYDENVDGEDVDVEAAVPCSSHATLYTADGALNVEGRVD